MLVGARVTRFVCQKIAQNVARPIVVKLNYITLTVGKIAQIISYVYCCDMKPCPKYVSNGPTSEHSPNLVDLVGTKLFVLAPEQTKG